MPIIYNQKHNQFHLFNDKVSYIMEVREGYLTHVYYGARINEFRQSKSYPQKDRSSFSPNPYELSNGGFSLDVVPQEFPGYDTGDYREGMYEFTYSDGTKATSMKFKSYAIFDGKKSLEGLPATYADSEEAQTLEIILEDSNRSIQAVLSYTIYKERPVITKSVKYINKSREKIVLNKALSSCVDFDYADFDMIQMPGAWAREKQLKRDPLISGQHILDSKRGASGVTQQPFVALVSSNADEFSGEVFAFHFVYSGNFKISVAVDTFEQTRVMMGLNSFNFAWVLQPEEVFQTPEVVMVYSNNGLNEMSQAFHKLYLERLARGKYKMAERPILINNWETTYFDFSEDKLVDLAERAKKLGVELFVLDDGWFGERHSDTTSLGDWVENQEKLPDGLLGLSKKIRDQGLKFGLWFEPEMISEESELFKEHSDWHLHVQGYPTSLGRNQLILDFSREEVRDAIFHKLTTILDQVPIDYIKWDMNRNMTEVASVGRNPEQQMETSHRYILGLYDLLERLIQRYPNILFENCSGGAGRFDPGMCYYMPQSWTSDNTDALERLKIQYSTSMIFPPVMMCAQLSEAPNHQVGRITDLDTRAAVAMSANFGLMLNLARETEEDLAKVASYIEWYKNHRQLIQFGNFYRLLNPYETNYGSWMFIDEKQEQGIVMFFEILAQASKPWVRLKLTGLDETAFYEIEDRIYSGDELMKFGLYLNTELSGDFQSKTLLFRKISE